ncbi:MAG: hypothetical protein RL065_2250 [Bacteroidota bacterium]
MIASTVTLNSCKKGSGDPLLTLRSRKARLVGTWTLSKQDQSNTYTSGGTTNVSTRKVDGTTLTVTTGGTSAVGTYTETLDITKDGKFTINSTETYSAGGSTFTTTEVVSGTWDFLSGVGDLKSKESIILKALSITQTSGGTSSVNTYSQTNNGTTWKITTLKNKSLIVDSDDEQTASSVSSYKNHLEYEQK